MNSRDAQLARIAALEHRVKRLAEAQAGPVVTGKVVRVPGHEVAAGTWDAHKRTGTCRHCRLPISGGTDSHHGWASEAGSTVCLARTEEN